MTNSVRIVAALCATGLMAAAAPAADAATRYAAPNGSSSDCTQSRPCKLRDAVRNAAPGDTVIVARGAYEVDHGLVAPGVLYIRGAAGTRPVLVGRDNLGQDTLSLPSGGTVDDLQIETHSPGNAALSMTGGTASDILAMSSDTAAGATAISLTGSLDGTVLRNSVAWARDSGATALGLSGTLGTSTVTGVTVWGMSGANGVSASDASVKTIRNSILHGGNYDVVTQTLGVGPIVSSSNYRSARATGLTAGLLDQEAAPMLSNVGGGDFRELSGSPTIDAGVADDLLGGVAVGGVARVGLPDIGGLEFGSNVVVSTGDGDDDDDNSGKGSSGSGTGHSGAGSGDHGNDGDADDDDSPGQGSPASGSGSTPAPSGSDPATTQPAATPPATDPEVGESVNLDGVTGAPTVRLPGTDAFIPLTVATTVPVGSVVDATNGQVSLTSARDAKGHTDTGRFWGAVFKVTQTGGKKPYTSLVLKGGDFSSCKAKGKKVFAAGAKSAVRGLWGRDDHGHFQTRGRHGSATVRGTRWFTQDRCDGTFFKVTRGAVVVHDKHAHRDVTVKRGHSYLARV